MYLVGSLSKRRVLVYKKNLCDEEGRGVLTAYVERFSLLSLTQKTLPFIVTSYETERS